MILGVLSDTHNIDRETILRIVDDFKNRRVECIIHCGDIEPEHLDADLFGGLPVICALIEEQMGKLEFENAPTGWTFTKPCGRIVQIDKYQKIYVGHKRSFDFLNGSEDKLIQTLQEIRKSHSGVRWFFSGHTHHQIFLEGYLINFVNPGAVKDSFDGIEYALVNTDNREIVFCRIPKTKSIRPTFSVGVMSDSFDITSMDPGYWSQLNIYLKERDVSCLIHCGNIFPDDIGRPELKDFQVYYNLRSDQKTNRNFENWHLIQAENPVVIIDGYKFYVQLDLGADLLIKSELDMHKLCVGLRRKYPEIKFVLCGFTNNSYLEEGETVSVINPGDTLKDRGVAIICLPRKEITFGHVPIA